MTDLKFRVKVLFVVVDKVNMKGASNMYTVGQEIIWETMFGDFFSGIILRIEEGCYIIRSTVFAGSTCSLPVDPTQQRLIRGTWLKA